MEEFDKEELRKFSNKVRERDMICLSCGSNKNLEAHHIYPKSIHRNKAYAISNGITLCKKCHRTSFLSYHSIFELKVSNFFTNMFFIFLKKFMYFIFDLIIIFFILLMLKGFINL